MSSQVKQYGLGQHGFKPHGLEHVFLCVRTVFVKRQQFALGRVVIEARQLSAHVRERYTGTRLTAAVRWWSPAAAATAACDVTAADAGLEAVEGEVDPRVRAAVETG